MSKGLEALEELKKDHSIDGRLPLIDRMRFELIEKELKCSQFICKKLNIHTEIKQDLDGRITYWLIYARYGLELTKEEYDLLKEVLL